MHSELSNNFMVYFQGPVLVLFDNIVAQIKNLNFVRLRVTLIDDYKKLFKQIVKINHRFQ